MDASYHCLSITVPPTAHDSVLLTCTVQGMLGCEEQDLPEGVKIRAYFKDEKSARQTCRVLKAINPAPAIKIEKIEDGDWIATWRESMKPARLAAGWYVSPLWLPPPPSVKHWITIEPKMAFGTGHHETTRLAAQALIERRKQIMGKQILDIGTGSGVLCFVADLCGARFSVGVETDAGCRGNLAENLRNNPPAGTIGLFIGNLDCVKKHELFDLIVMNMLLTEAAPLFGDISALLSPDGCCIWSGLMNDERKEVVSLAENYQLSLISRKQGKEWWCGVFNHA